MVVATLAVTFRTSRDAPHRPGFSRRHTSPPKSIAQVRTVTLFWLLRPQVPTATRGDLQRGHETLNMKRSLLLVALCILCGLTLGPAAAFGAASDAASRTAVVNGRVLNLATGAF